MILYSVEGKAISLVCLILFHTAVASPIVRRELLAPHLAGPEGRSSIPEDTAVAQTHHQETLSESEVFGGHVEEGESGGRREKRLIKLGTGLGAGLKAAGLLGAKAAGKALSSVALKIAKAAVTIGIAKLLLTLVFGKINQVIDFKTRLLNNQGLLGVSSLSSSSGGSQPAAPTDVASTDQDDDLPVIDPDKVTIQVPDQVITSGFNVVNRAAPIVGSVIQNAAERIARIVEILKPGLRSSVGVNIGASASASTSLKREAGVRRRGGGGEQTAELPETPIKNSYVALTQN